MLIHTRGKFTNLSAAKVITEDRRQDERGEECTWRATFEDGSSDTFVASLTDIADALSAVIPAPLGYRTLTVDGDCVHQEPVLAFGIHRDECIPTLYTPSGRAYIDTDLGLLMPDGRVQGPFQLHPNSEAFLASARTKAA
jgi:hypothetical protein